MATAENAKLEYEAGQAAVAMSALTDSGGAAVFTSAAATWSGRSGYAPVVRPDGLLTGGAITPAVTNNVVNVAALTCNLAGVVTSVAGAPVTITRPAGTVAKVISITVNSSGALAAVAGTDGASAAFSESRAAAGGPPLIPVGSIEIGQVRVTTSVAAVVASAQIYAVPGLHVERADFPLYDINYTKGQIEFLAALPKIHTGTLPKGVFASYASPIFAEVDSSDFVPPETSHSVSSTQIYGRTIGATSSTLGQGSFTAYLANGVSDGFVALKNETLWFRFYPDRYQSAYILAQGKLGISRTFPAGDQIQAAATISASEPAIEVA
jgi:antitoxin (DNA-binding transcriptional repressor) of toxin-antitoxin stability system